MRLITRKSLFTITANVLLLLGCGAASAVPITGGVVISGGGATPTDGTNATTLDLATAIDFTSPGGVFGGTGDFASIPMFTLVTMSDFTFSPSTGVDPLWTFTFGGITYSFAATSFTVNAQNANTLGITGSGTLSATGFDDTVGSWSFSMDTIDGTTLFGWSSTTVPEPATIALFGMGLLGLAFTSRRRRQRIQ